MNIPDDVAENGLDGKLQEEFRKGIAPVYGRRIWTFLLDEFRNGTTQQKLARAVGGEQSGVSKGKNQGRMTFEQLVALSLGCGFEFRDLPLKPSTTVFAEAGYLHCMHFLRHVLWQEKHHTFESMDLRIMLTFWKEPRWILGDEKQKETVFNEALKNHQTFQILQERVVLWGNQLMKRILEMHQYWYRAWAETDMTIRTRFSWAKQS